jgi:hypothetical protein
MRRWPIKRNQILKSLGHNYFIIVSKKTNRDKWKVKVLTEKTNVFAGTHTMSEITLWKNFELIP